MGPGATPLPLCGFGVFEPACRDCVHRDHARDAPSLTRPGTPCVSLGAMCTVGKSAAPPSFGETSAGRAHTIYLDATSFTITHAGAYKELPRSTVVRDRGLDPVHRGLLRLMESLWGECCVFGAHPSWARAAPPGAGAGGLGPGATPLPLCGFAGARAPTTHGALLFASLGTAVASCCGCRAS